MSVQQSNPENAEQIREQMRQTRCHLQPEVNRIVEDAQKLMDWHYYMKRAPWMMLGVAAAVGYVLVPKRLEVMSPDADELEKLSKKQRLVVEPKPKANSRTGPIASLAGFLAMTALRAGVGYAGQYIGKQIEENSKSQQRSQEPQQVNS
ncbi:MAG TPA: hypothetical protein DD473_28535 [Planctomycetaceae bacterium]|nr:hypothetical protein [Planctomycetaceae bacterium]|tara:strand:- start:603 stop:1049 length:447 start_codon:yes stop_codon:yes gene_type:complete